MTNDELKAFSENQPELAQAQDLTNLNTPYDIAQESSQEACGQSTEGSSGNECWLAYDGNPSTFY
eukprot:CAMPEP_0197532946 /NCGR_PEP_ID=MMETSP1318-20131121/41611_1 /TAXON_ID=552666 /ORGANISM="Partenskyella glossopodia, Strain RCC365" /LENGTH=64 /DNA_ID=CAMNT_0043089667 /DNA_START=1 /DNA_END=192 /DNA_ORIENTATION=-